MLARRTVTRFMRRSDLQMCSVSIGQSHRTLTTDSMVDAHKVTVQKDQWGGAGAFAAVAIKSGDVIEKGIARILTNIDGNENPYVFTWSNERPCATWAICSGCSTFYNTADAEQANTHMQRNFEDNTFVITATKDIPAGAELFHEYKSKKWRTCFAVLNRA